MRRDIDEALNDWAYDPDPGALTVRQVRTRDGRWVIQIRKELGLMQMECDGRPDGARPHGFSTYLDYLRYRAERRVQTGTTDPDWLFTPDHCLNIEREFMQFYHRRVAWLALNRYDKVLLDAHHTLSLMNFVRAHFTQVDYIDSHERFRGMVYFHETQARTGIALEENNPEKAIDAIRQGVLQIGHHLEEWQESHGEDDETELPDSELLDQLREIEAAIRKRYDVGKTLHEQLHEAIVNEDYEQAAQIRDRMNGH